MSDGETLIRLLGMTSTGLARCLGCSDATVRGWGASMPPAVLAWLQQCYDSKPDWRRPMGRPWPKKDKAP